MHKRTVLYASRRYERGIRLYGSQRPRVIYLAGSQKFDRTEFQQFAFLSPRYHDDRVPLTEYEQMQREQLILSKTYQSEIRLC